MISTVIFASGRAWVRSAFPVSSAIVRASLDPRLKRIGNPREKAPALARNRARPGGKGIGRGLHCARDVLGAPSGDLGDRAPVGRILDLEHLI